MALRADIQCRDRVERAHAGPNVPPWAEEFANRTLGPLTPANCAQGTIRVLYRFSDGSEAEVEAEHPALLGYSARRYALRVLRGTTQFLPADFPARRPLDTGELAGMPLTWRGWWNAPGFPVITVDAPQIPARPEPEGEPTLGVEAPGAPLGPGLPPGGFGAGETSLPELLKRLGQRREGEAADFAGIVAVLVQGLGIADRIRATLSSVAPDLSKELGPSLAALAPLLDQLPPGLTAGLTPPLDNLARTWGITQAESTRLLLANEQVEGEKNRGANEELVEGVARRLREGAPAFLQGLVKTLAGLLEFLGDRVQDLGELLVNQIGAVYRDALEAQAPVTTANVAGVAGGALKNALAAGLAAQTAALLLELLHPLKRLGLNQVVGFVADFAGFAQVAGAFTGPSLRHGLQVPAEHRAASVFRTNVPSPGEALEQAYQRHISLADYAHILALHGFPSWWVKVLVDDAFVDPRPRELAQLLEASEVDPGWVALKLRENGWDDGDVEKGTAALFIRGTQPGRSRVMSAAMREYANGRLTATELERHLDAASLRPEHKALWLRAARLERRGDLMESLGTRVVKQYREDVTTREAAEAELTGLGFTPDEVRARLLGADLDRQVVQLREDTQEAEAHIRQIRTAALTNLRTQFRAGFVPRRVLVAWGEALGFTTAYLENVADLEELKGPPSKAETLPVMGLGAVREAADTVARLLEDEVRRGRVTALRAAAILAELGLDPATVRGALTVAEVLGLPTPGSLGIPMPDGRGGTLGWEGVLAELLGEVRRGTAARQVANDAYAVLGIPAAHTASRDPVLDLIGRIIRTV